MVFFDPRVFYILFAVAIIIGLFRLIKWLLSGIKGLLTGQRNKPDKRQSKDWLVRAQARQEIRFENSLPPIQKQGKPQRKTLVEKQREKKGMSPTGWTFNEETQLWEPPKNLKK